MTTLNDSFQSLNDSLQRDANEQWSLLVGGGGGAGAGAGAGAAVGLGGVSGMTKTQFDAISTKPKASDFF